MEIEEVKKEINKENRLQRKVVRNNWKEFKRNSSIRFEEERFKLIKYFLDSEIPQFNITFRVVS